MKYTNILNRFMRKVFTLIWNPLSLFFGFTYEEQAKRMKNYDLRGKTNPKSTATIYRANKVSKN